MSCKSPIGLVDSFEDFLSGKAISSRTDSLVILGVLIFCLIFECFDLVVFDSKSSTSPIPNSISPFLLLLFQLSCLRNSFAEGF